MKISTILDKVDEHQLFVPAFQREYVWKRDDVKQLIDSLIKDYPTGTMLIWETASPPELKGPHKYDSKQGAVRLLLDGQQRVTSLYMLIRGDLPPYYTPKEIENDTRGLYVNLETLELSYYVKTRMKNDPLWQNITEVFSRKIRARDIIRDLESKGEVVDSKRQDLIDDNARAIESVLDRDFPEQTIPIKANVRVAIDIFHKVNSGGVSLTDAELALAQISGYWPQARDLFKAKLEKLKEEGFDFNLDFIVYVLLGCVHHMGSDMKKLHAEENNEPLRKAWEQLDKQLLDYVVNLLRQKAFVDHSHEINSIYALVPIIVYCFDKGKEHPSELEIKKIVKWFYYSQIRRRYISQLPQKLDRDLRTLIEAKSPFDELLATIEEERPLDIKPDEFAARSISHPLFGAVKWYFKSQGAVCLTTGVGIRKNMGPKYQLEHDHIFPYSRLKSAGYGKGNRVKYQLAQEMTNRAVLTQSANRTKSNKTAREYLASVKERFPSALELQCIPEDTKLWELENYEDFLKERRKILAHQLNSFLQGITETSDSELPVTIGDLIAEGESGELEFKSSLRWDLGERVVNKKLEDVVVKTVAAFANSEGGALLIGVSDDGQLLGLESDYHSLGDADRDKFELHLRNLLNKHFGTSYVATNVDINFHEIEDKEICQVLVSACNEPMIIATANKSGQQVEKFYVRSGNSSQEISLSEMNTYIQSRFRS